MIKVGLVNLDTSHVIAFSQRFHKTAAEDQWVDGALTTHAFLGESNVRTPAEMEAYATQLKDEFGIELVDSLEELADRVDAVCVESNEGWRHLELARPFLERGMRCFIDKPFAGNYEQAKQIVELAKEHGGAVMSCSSLRFGDEVVKFNEEHAGKVTSCDAITPSPYHWANPGLQHYGIHGVEILFAVMGTGCVDVRSLSLAGQELCVGRWADGRIGSVRGLHVGRGEYGFRATVDSEGKAGVHHITVNAAMIYRNMLREMVKFFETGVSNVPPEQTLEIMGFMDAAALSAKLNGAPASMPW